ncbi:MAG: small basic family protein [Actinobacteria bacterium]|nr:small basic family protein [Actinomycetota bacterium]
MWVIVTGLAVGIIFGSYFPLFIPIIYGRYLSIAVLAALDTAFGGLRAYLEGRFDNNVFISGFFFNALLAAFFTYVGDRLGVELYLAALFALGVRVFGNLGTIRRYLLADWGKHHAAELAKRQAEKISSETAEKP